jgi:hypothetical protein
VRGKECGRVRLLMWWRMEKRRGIRDEVKGRREEEEKEKEEEEEEKGREKEEKDQ